MKDSETKRKPEIVVFAGANGSGKSTITNLFQLNMDYINADDIKRSIHCSDKEAAIKAEELREAHVAENENFAFETVMSTERNLNLLKKAKAKGYFIRCIYVITFSPDINVLRVQSRVATGGHGVPEDKIISRYYRSMDLIKSVVPVCDICNIYDNSSDEPFRVFKKRKDEYFCEECEDWLYDDIVELTGITELKESKLN